MIQVCSYLGCAREFIINSLPDEMEAGLTPLDLRAGNLIQTSLYNQCSGSIKITTHLDHISYGKTASGTNWSNILTYRLFIINTRRD